MIAKPELVPEGGEEGLSRAATDKRARDPGPGHGTAPGYDPGLQPVPGA
jgi:hypothetical protein